MKKWHFYLFLGAAIFLGAFEFHIQYLFWQDMDFGSFFSSVLYSVIGQESDKLISINLYNKSLVLIEGGNLVKRDKIAAAGNPKTSATPVGNFKVLTKNKRIISSLSGLVMPYSLRIKGPYFIHGPPTYKNGMPYYSEYSQGCVRLGLGLEQEVYNWADIGTNVEIYNSSLVKSQDDPSVYYLTPDGGKEHILNPDEFLKRGFRWRDVKTIPAAELEAIPSQETKEKVASL